MQERKENSKKRSARIEWPEDVHGYLIERQGDIQKETRKRLSLTEIAFRIIRSHRDQFKIFE